MTQISTPIARFDLVVIDTPEPRRLAEFYCALLGWCRRPGRIPPFRSSPTWT